MGRRVLYVRDGDGVVDDVAAVAEELRRTRRGARVSDADVARQLIRAALDSPAILKRLGMNGRGRKHPQATAC